LRAGSNPRALARGEFDDLAPCGVNPYPALRHLNLRAAIADHDLENGTLDQQ
jgi:hypothetical protein